MGLELKVGDRFICAHTMGKFYLKTGKVIGFEYGSLRIEYDNGIQGQKKWTGPRELYEKMFINNKLNKKLYPSYKEWGSFLVSPETAGKLKESNE